MTIITKSASGTFACLLILATVLTLEFSGLCAFAKNSSTLTTSKGSASLVDFATMYVEQHPNAQVLGPKSLGGLSNIFSSAGLPIPSIIPASLLNNIGLSSAFPPVLSSNTFVSVPSQLDGGILKTYMSMVPTSGNPVTDYESYLHGIVGQMVSNDIQHYPLNAALEARAEQSAQFIALSNAMGELTKAQSIDAIDYASRYMKNFTTEGGNKWNAIRDKLFVPIALLLLLPGAVLCQVKAMIDSNNPVTGESVNPLEGITRSIIAIFLIPASYLVVNYSIDLSNSITRTIAETYSNQFGADMYQDAVDAQMQAFPVRQPSENQGADVLKPWNIGTISDNKSFEKELIMNKSVMPGSNTPVAMPNKADEGMPAAAIAARSVLFSTNAGMTTTWNVLCAFQMAYMVYLFLLGPIMAALWVYPIQSLRQAFPSWVEGVVTLGFWSLFWNTTVLLMACFKADDGTGTMIMTALNFLAVSSVKFAFDFSGLVKAAAGEAASSATKMLNGKGQAQDQGQGKGDAKSAAGDKNGKNPLAGDGKLGDIAQAGLKGGLPDKLGDALSDSKNPGMFDRSGLLNGSALGSEFGLSADSLTSLGDKIGLPPSVESRLDPEFSKLSSQVQSQSLNPLAGLTSESLARNSLISFPLDDFSLARNPITNTFSVLDQNGIQLGQNQLPAMGEFSRLPFGDNMSVLASVLSPGNEQYSLSNLAAGNLASVQYNPETGGFSLNGGNPSSLSAVISSAIPIPLPTDAGVPSLFLGPNGAIITGSDMAKVLLPDTVASDSTALNSTLNGQMLVTADGHKFEVSSLSALTGSFEIKSVGETAPFTASVTPLAGGQCLVSADGVSSLVQNGQTLACLPSDTIDGSTKSFVNLPTSSDDARVATTMGYKDIDAGSFSSQFTGASVANAGSYSEVPSVQFTGASVANAGSYSEVPSAQFTGASAANASSYSEMPSAQFTGASAANAGSYSEAPSSQFTGASVANAGSYSEMPSAQFTGTSAANAGSYSEAPSAQFTSATLANAGSYSEAPSSQFTGTSVANAGSYSEAPSSQFTGTSVANAGSYSEMPSAQFTGTSVGNASSYSEMPSSQFTGKSAANAGSSSEMPSAQFAGTSAANAGSYSEMPSSQFTGTSAANASSYSEMPSAQITGKSAANAGSYSEAPSAQFTSASLANAGSYSEAPSSQFTGTSVANAGSYSEMPSAQFTGTSAANASSYSEMLSAQITGKSAANAGSSSEMPSVQFTGTSAANAGSYSEAPSSQFTGTSAANAGSSSEMPSAQFTGTSAANAGSYSEAPSSQFTGTSVANAGSYSEMPSVQFTGTSVANAGSYSEAPSSQFTGASVGNASSYSEMPSSQFTGTSAANATSYSEMLSAQITGKSAANAGSYSEAPSAQFTSASVANAGSYSEAPSAQFTGTSAANAGSYSDAPSAEFTGTSAANAGSYSDAPSAQFTGTSVANAGSYSEMPSAQFTGTSAANAGSYSEAPSSQFTGASVGNASSYSEMPSSQITGKSAANAGSSSEMPSAQFTGTSAANAGSYSEMPSSQFTGTSAANAGLYSEMPSAQFIGVSVANASSYSEMPSSQFTGTSAANAGSYSEMPSAQFTGASVANAGSYSVAPSSQITGASVANAGSYSEAPSSQFTGASVANASSYSEMPSAQFTGASVANAGSYSEMPSSQFTGASVANASSYSEAPSSQFTGTSAANASSYSEAPSSQFTGTSAANAGSYSEMPSAQFTGASVANAGSYSEMPSAQFTGASVANAGSYSEAPSAQFTGTSAANAGSYRQAPSQFVVASNGTSVGSYSESPSHFVVASNGTNVGSYSEAPSQFAVASNGANVGSYSETAVSSTSNHQDTSRQAAASYHAPTEGSLPKLSFAPTKDHTGATFGSLLAGAFANKPAGEKNNGPSLSSKNADTLDVSKNSPPKRIDFQASTKNAVGSESDEKRRRALKEMLEALGPAPADC